MKRRRDPKSTPGGVQNGCPEARCLLSARWAQGGRQERSNFLGERSWRLLENYGGAPGASWGRLGSPGGGEAFWELLFCFILALNRISLVLCFDVFVLSCGTPGDQGNFEQS